MPHEPDQEPRLRVVQLLPGLGVGGAERVATLLALGLAGHGVEAEVIALGAPSGSHFERQLADASIRVHFMDKVGGFDPRVIPRLARRLRRFRPHVVHTHLHTLKYLLPAVSPRHRPAIVHTVHNLAEREALAHDRRVQRLAFALGVAPVAIGQAVADSIVEVYGRPARATITNGIPVSAYRHPPASRSEMRQALELQDGCPTVLCVGRLDAQKDHATLLSAFADPRLVGARLMLAGDGELRPDLERQASDLGISDRVSFLGVRSDVPSLLAACDLVALSSRWEGYPLVVMEGLAAGRPVVATTVGCLDELVDDQTGRLVPAQDPAALADALAELVGNGDLREAMGNAASSAAERRFDVSVMTRSYLELYRRMVAER